MSVLIKIILDLEETGQRQMRGGVERHQAPAGPGQELDPFGRKQPKGKAEQKANPNRRCTLWERREDGSEGGAYSSTSLSSELVCNKAGTFKY